MKNPNLRFVFQNSDRMTPNPGIIRVFMQKMRIKPYKIRIGIEYEVINDGESESEVRFSKFGSHDPESGYYSGFYEKNPHKTV